MRLLERKRFAPPPTVFERQVVPVLSVMLGSLVAALLPVVATAPDLPPFGFLVLIAWRLARSDIWPVWAPLPLGLFDDLFSGQPLGSAAALWTFAFLAIDAIDRRFVWRDHAQDWAVAVALIALYLLGSAGLAALLGGRPWLALLLPQLVVSALAYPLIARACAALDAWRYPR